MVSDLQSCCNSDNICGTYSLNMASHISSALYSPQSVPMFPSNSNMSIDVYSVTCSKPSFPSCDGCYCQCDDNNNKDEATLDPHCSDTHCLHASPSPTSASSPLQKNEFNPTFYNPFETKHRRRTSRTQYQILEKAFQDNPKPSSANRLELAEQLDMTPRGVQIWFQNRRAKAKLRTVSKDETASKGAHSCTSSDTHGSSRSAKRRRAESKTTGRPQSKPLFTEWNSHDPLPGASVTDQTASSQELSITSPVTAQTTTGNPLVIEDDTFMPFNMIDEPSTPHQPVGTGNPSAVDLDPIYGCYGDTFIDGQAFFDFKPALPDSPTSFFDASTGSTDSTPILHFQLFRHSGMDAWTTDSAGVSDPCPTLIGSTVDVGTFNVADEMPTQQPIWQDIQTGVISSGLPAQHPHHARRHSDPEEYLSTLGALAWDQPLAHHQSAQPQLSRRYSESFFDLGLIAIA